MTRAKRTATDMAFLATSCMPGLILTAVIAFTCCQESVAGNHHVESPPHRCSGCIDGSCGVPSPYGYYRGGWRRWPGSRDSTMDAVGQGSSPRQPVVPEPFEEGRTRPRTRSDKPLEPDEMTGSMPQPMVPGAGDEANPFSNSVPDSDLPTPGDASPFGGDADPGLAPAPTGDGDVFGGGGGGFGGGGAGDTDAETTAPLFDTPPDAGGGDFDFSPGGTAPPAPAGGTDDFDFSGPSRTIKSRGVQLQKGIQLNSVAALPTSVTGPAFELPVEDSVGGKFSDGNIGLVSFDGLEPNDFEALSNPPQPKTLNNNQVKEATQLSHAKLSQKQLSQTETMERNPLRRGPNLRRSTVSKKKPSKVEQLVEPIEIETPIDLPETKTVTRSLANATSSRPVRDNLRKNPLRR